MALNSFKKIHRWLTAGFTLVASIVLLVIGVPRFLHQLMLVPGTPILERINAGEPVTEEELSTLEKSCLNALDFVKLPKTYTDLGSSYLTRARTAIEREEQLKHAQRSIDASMKGLNMAPLNTFAWLRVAIAYVILGPDSHSKALEAWRMSIATAKFEPFILMRRIHLGIILYGEMTTGDIELLKDQLRMAYKWQPDRLRQYVRENNLVPWVTVLKGPRSEMVEYLSEQASDT